MYKSGETVREIAEKNNCCYDTILHLLKINGIDTRKHVVGVRIVELNMSFKSVKDCVAYMIENEYVSEGAQPSSIGTSIRRVMNGKKKTFKNLTFEKVD